ncbi:MAG TPA: hypothetical protein VL981_06200 [Candidatus Methylacidiphilales bacterium]|nr:hypothetical protein [Candidatus Methylacidiphilales bacterium]
MKRNTCTLFNEAAPTSRSPQFYKRKLAMAIGRPELADAPDEDLEKAHDEHMETMNQLIAGGGPILQTDDWRNNLPASMAARGNVANSSAGTPATMANEKQRMAEARLLIRQAVADGMAYDDAFNAVFNARPDLFPKAHASLTNDAQKLKTSVAGREAEAARRREFLALVNEKMETTKFDYDLCFNIVRRERPDLMPPATNARR